MFGGYGNTKLMIRKRVQNYPIKELVLSSVVSELRPLKVLIEVTKGKNHAMKHHHHATRNNLMLCFFSDGHIRVHTDNKEKPILEAYDPFVLPVQYLSFASYQGASVEFLYNCVSDKTTADASKDIHPLPAVTTNDISEIPLEGEIYHRLTTRIMFIARIYN